jgi:Na+/proline symporter
MNDAFTLTLWDYAIIGAYFGFCLWVGVHFKKKGEQQGMDSYVVAGRNLPWWLIGTSMVATTFSAETPLLVSNFVYRSGISKNWEWWCLLPGAMLTTFFFARLWRRTEVLTDAQYVTLRYSGPEAHVLRAFRALYMGFVMNAIMIGSQMIVSGKFGTTLLGKSPADADYMRWNVGIAVVLSAVALFYSSLAGIAGIVVTDLVQFGLAMTGAIMVAYFALAQPQVGGLAGLVEKTTALTPAHLDFLPRPGAADAAKLTFAAFTLFITMRWWAQVYGGAEPGGASHVAQRMLSARNERQALFGTLWFNIAHYALRPWPWILTGLACMLIFPNAVDGERAYIRCLNFVPGGLKGLVLAGFFSALMAIDTRLNMGAAYFVNDFYRPYLVRGRDEKHYVNVSRMITVVQMLMALAMFQVATEVKSIFFITLAIGSGTGLVFLLRWYWWRISAWSEIAALAAGLVNLAVFRFVIYPQEKDFNDHALMVQLFAIIGVTLVWIAVTLLTPPTDMQSLKMFYRKVRPAGPGWGRVARAVREEDGTVIDPGYSMSRAAVSWVSAVVMVYAMLFGSGKMLLGQPTLGAGLLALAAGAFVVLWGSLQTARAEVPAALSAAAAGEGS